VVKEFGSDDLNALVDEGLRNSPSYASAQATLKAAREQLRGQIGDKPVPKIDLEFDPSRQRSLGIPVLPQQTFIENVFVAQANASYTFDFLALLFLADRAPGGPGKAHRLCSSKPRAVRWLPTSWSRRSIRPPWLSRFAATEALVNLGEERARQIASRYKLGGASREEMLSSEQDAANAAATLPALRAQALAVRHAQAVLIGRTPDNAPPQVFAVRSEASGERPLSRCPRSVVAPET